MWQQLLYGVQRRILAVAVAGVAGWACWSGAPVQAEESMIRIVPTNYENMYEAYEANSERGQSTLVTSDSVLHTAHVLFNYTLRAAELRKFDQNIREITDAMTAHMAGKAEDEARKRYLVAPPPYGYERVAAYFGVAQKLLNPDAQMPEIIRGTVDEEVRLILAANTVAVSPVMGVEEDYTQYKPRGHYTRNEQFERYFRAMMWYGRAGFPISGQKKEGTPLTKDEARANAWAGIMLSRGMAEVVLAHIDTAEGGRAFTALDMWRTVYEPTEFIVGHSDDLMPPEYLELSRKVFGDTLPGGWTADVQQKTDTFIAEAVALRPPKILGGLQDDVMEKPPVTLRFMGQRFIPDSEMFQRLVHPYVADRLMPTGLDVMAVLGSDLAVNMLKERGEFKYPAYDTQLAALQAEVAALDDQAWSQNAYYIWLSALRSLVDDPAWSGEFPEGYVGRARPVWWNDPLWKAKQLNAALGSWAELRHDTILYAKQSYTFRVTAAFPGGAKEPMVYVEPAPRVYGRLITLMSSMRKQLTEQGVFPKELEPNYDEFTRLLRGLLLVSTQETLTPEEREQVEFEQPTRDDLQRIRAVGSVLKRVETLPEPLRSQLTGEEDAKASLIADVHTDPNSKQVLEVGVGKVMLVSVPVGQAGGARTVWCQGPIFSYYEFAQPMDQRLTDGEWQQMLAARRAPNPFILHPFLGR